MEIWPKTIVYSCLVPKPDSVFHLGQSVSWSERKSVKMKQFLVVHIIMMKIMPKSILYSIMMKIRSKSIVCSIRTKIWPKYIVYSIMMQMKPKCIV